MKSVSSPLKLVLSPRVQDLLDHFAEVLGIRVTFYDADHRILCRGLRMRNCEFCRKIQEEYGLLARCVEMDGKMQEEAGRDRKELCYTCHAGLKEVLAPIYIEGQLGGYIMLGQFRDTEYCPSHLPPELQQDFFALPCYDTGQLQGILGLLKMMLDYISARELATLKGRELRREIIGYIALHSEAKISLKEVADYLGRSVSYVSHELRERYNTTFTDLLLEQRISLAEDMMSAQPRRSLREIARLTGFSEASYFSRMYKKYRGMAPTAFRRKCLREDCGYNQPESENHGNSDCAERQTHCGKIASEKNLEKISQKSVFPACN